MFKHLWRILDKIFFCFNGELIQGLVKALAAGKYLTQRLDDKKLCSHINH